MVCGLKPENGKNSQMTVRQSDSFIIALKQGNTCGAKGRADRPFEYWETAAIHSDGNKQKTQQYSYIAIARGLSEEPCVGNLQARFSRGGWQCHHL